MNKDRIIACLFGIMMNINSEYAGLSFDEMLMASSDKIMSISLSLTFEIRELLEKGYSEEEIIEMIRNIHFDEYADLSDMEKEYIKKDAKKTLRLIINNKEKEND